LRARWYDPATGRFTQVDPFPGLLSLPGTQHPYAYTLNNPLRYTDPSGESVLATLALVSAGIIGGFIGGVGAYTIKTLEQATPCMPWHRHWNWRDALDWGIKGELLGGLIVLSALGLAGFIASPWAGLVMTRLGLAFFGGLASGIGYAIPAMIFGTFDARQFAVAVGVGALFGAFPDFLGGAGGAAFLRGALANELQYVVSAVVCDDIQSLTPIGHLANIGVGGAIGWRTGPSVSPKFDSVWLRSVVPEVYENMGGRYANQFLWTAVEQALQESKRQFFRSATGEMLNNVAVDRLPQVLKDIVGWLKP